MKYDKDLSCPKGRRGRAGEPGFPAKKIQTPNCVFIFFELKGV
jgi:hypothetical protein